MPNSLCRAARYAGFEGILGFSVPSIFWVGARSMQITMFERARPAWPTKTKLRINGKGNRDGEWNFCRRREADIALFLQVTRITQLRKFSKQTNHYSPKRDDHKQQTLKHRNKPNGSKSINYKSWPFELFQVQMCFLRWKNPKFHRSFARVRRLRLDASGSDRLSP